MSISVILGFVDNKRSILFDFATTKQIPINIQSNTNSDWSNGINDNPAHLVEKQGRYEKEINVAAIPKMMKSICKKNYNNCNYFNKNTEDHCDGIITRYYEYHAHLISVMNNTKRRMLLNPILMQELLWLYQERVTNFVV